MADPFLYTVWQGMRNRCNNPNVENYARYGGRGIQVCSEWDSYYAFERDMLPTWFEGAILDRRENNLHYTKDNCRWVTPHQSAINRRSTKLNFEKAEEIRRLWGEGTFNGKELAQQFDVVPSYISMIIRRKVWSTVNG